jgi:serine/threonine protein phosphatase PrpC
MAPKKISALRKRLSISECDPVASAAGAGGDGSSGDNRGLLMALKGTDILDNLHADEKQTKGRRMSLSAVTDKNKQRRQSFTAKDEAAEGGTKEELHDQLLKMGIGIVCKKGLKPESPNQDSFSLVHVEGKFTLYGVYDGHGPAGHDVSNFARETIPKLFLKNPNRESKPEEALVEAFEQTQKLLEHLNAQRECDCSMSGSTCTVVYQPHEEKYLVVAHAGDSRAVLGMKKDGKIVSTDLTVDHKPNLPIEKARIEKAGGRVVFDGYYNHRVFTKDGRGGLNMSRALGDSVAHKAGVTATPETKRVPVDVSVVDTSAGDDIVLLVCSDGVWEFIESQEAVEMVEGHARDKVQAAAEQLSKEAWDRWIDDSGGEVSDDITCIVAHLGSK